jgi:hypothetical protein
MKYIHGIVLCLEGFKIYDKKKGHNKNVELMVVSRKPVSIK